MTEDQVNALVERFVLSFEKIATALEGLDETYKRHYNRQYPEKGPVREAIVTRVPTKEDRIKEAHGASDRPIDDWLEELEGQDEDLGVREREWLERQNQRRRNAGPGKDS